MKGKAINATMHFSNPKAFPVYCLPLLSLLQLLIKLINQILIPIQGIMGQSASLLQPTPYQIKIGKN